jgi:hypothetical protein
MKIELKEITIGALTEGYKNNEEEGVVGYGGKLNIRPKYQREFIYKPAQQEAVIDTVQKGFPLNTMYWMVNDDGTFEVLDGQQRTISVCQFINGDFSMKGIFGREELMYFHNLTGEERQKILDYKLMVYFCEGTDKERLEWFRTINIAGEKLTDQELLNAVYTGEWLTDAKRHFSKTNCAAYHFANRYLNGSPIRQDYLETAIKWISHNDIEGYMSKHQQDANASELWQYFQNVIHWAQTTFPQYRKEMQGIAWGELYNRYKDTPLNAANLEKEVSRLMEDEDVTNKRGIYEYLWDGQERHLNIRAFRDSEKRTAYEKQEGICPYCKKHFDIKEMEADHITPWHEGGKTTAANCQMLCKECNRRKSGK